MTATTSTTDPTTESPADERFVEHPLAPGRIAIHDPAIVEDNGTYYVFGTHRRCARSTDLVHWERFENNLTRDPTSLLGGIWEAWPKQPENPALEGNTWAPDVIWNDVMRKWCMYLSVNGHEFRSVIVLLTADRLDGDWTYVGPVIYSGFNVDNVGRTDVPRVLGDEAAHGDLSRYASLKDTRINAIDAAPIRCDHGELWMSFGSWFGGIWMFKLDPKTGLRDYSVRYPLVHDFRRPVLRREGRRRLLELRRRLVFRAPQRLVVSVHGVWLARPHRRLPDPSVSFAQPRRPVRRSERQPRDFQR